jgi:metal-sulfur cluster biosynthetic enzyme
MVKREQVVDALHLVEDPELGMDIVELGLFYDAEIDGPKVKVLYSLTSMGCPAGQMIHEDIVSTVAALDGVEEVEAELTFDPPWTPDRMSEDAKFILGFGYSLEARRPAQPGIERTILPSCSPASRRSCAARASASGKTRSTCTRARPLRTSS